MSHDITIEVSFAVTDEACAIETLDRLRDVVAELEVERSAPGPRDLGAWVRVAGGWPVSAVADRLAARLTRSRLARPAAIRIRDAEHGDGSPRETLPVLVERRIDPA